MVNIKKLPFIASQDIRIEEQNKKIDEMKSSIGKLEEKFRMLTKKE